MLINNEFIKKIVVTECLKLRSQATEASIKFKQYKRVIAINYYGSSGGLEHVFFE